jgi:predicted nuclease with TOPRIM domain
MDEFGNIYNKKEDKQYQKKNNELIKQQLASNKAKAEEERERKKLEDEANRLAEKNNISPNDFKQRKKKGPNI